MKQNLILKKKILDRNITAGVVGLGYVGLPLAILLAEGGIRILGFDIDKKKIKLINSKKSYIERIGKNKIELLTKKDNNCFSNFQNIKECDVIIICVPTSLKNNKPDLSNIRSSFSSIRKYLKKNQILILESTSYPGTTEEEIVNKIKQRFKIGENFYVGFSSERINPGVNENSLREIPKVTSGYTKNCSLLISKFYSMFFKKIVEAKSLKIAEFSKLLENIYRAVNISFYNEMKLVADKMHLDIFDVIEVAKTKPYGFRPFNPGPGYGGHCIPIDPIYMFYKAKKYNIQPKFIKLAADVNNKIILHIINKLKLVLKNKNKNKNKNLKKSKILILGLAYKKNMDDIRESASIKLLNKLKKLNFDNLYCHDTHIKSYQIANHKSFKILKKIDKNILKRFDVTILMTDHDNFPYKLIYNNSKNIIDCRGKFKLDSKVIRG